MIDAEKYSAFEKLRDGRRFEIRALKPEDRASLVSAVERVGAQSLYRRFFAVRRNFTEQETDFFVNVDFVNHVALAAIADNGGRTMIVGGGRYVLVKPGKAEVAFAVVDQYQSQGIGTVLMRHLAAIAREAGLQELVADVLPENVAMLKVFERSGLRVSAKRESGTVHLTMRFA